MIAAAKVCLRTSVFKRRKLEAPERAPPCAVHPGALGRGAGLIPRPQRSSRRAHHFRLCWPSHSIQGHSCGCPRTTRCLGVAATVGGQWEGGGPFLSTPDPHSLRTDSSPSLKDWDYLPSILTKDRKEEVPFNLCWMWLFGETKKHKN